MKKLKFILLVALAVGLLLSVVGCDDPQIISAIEKMDTNQIKALIEKNKECVNSKDGAGKTPVMRAIEKERTDIVEMLLDAGADVNAEDSRGETVLMYAAGYGNKEVVKLLLARNVNINAKDDCNFTALMTAANSGNAEIVNMLLKKYASVDNKVKDRVILNRHKDGMIVTTDIGGWTALMFAVEDRNLFVIDLLMDAGANPYIRSEAGKDAFDLAAGNSDVLKLLKKEKTE